VRNLTITHPPTRGEDVDALQEALERQEHRLGLPSLGWTAPPQTHLFDHPTLEGARHVGAELGAPLGQLVGPVRPWLQLLIRAPWRIHDADAHTRRRAHQRMLARKRARMAGSYPLFGDFSGYNEGVDLAAMRRAGVWVVMLKLTEGDDFTSDTGIARWREAGEEGFVRIPYHFARPSRNGPQREIGHYLDVLHAAGGLGPRDRLCIDWEDPAFENAGRAAGDRWLAQADRAAGGRLDWLYSYGGYAAATLTSTHGMAYHHAAYNRTPLANVPSWARKYLAAAQFTNGTDGLGPHWLPGGGRLGGRRAHDVNRILDRSWLR